MPTPALPADQQDFASLPTLGGQVGGQGVEFPAPADERDTGRDGGHAISIPQTCVPGFSAAVQWRHGMFLAGPPARLAGMDISVHAQPNAHPVKTEWVDDALAGAYAAGHPLGALVGRPLTPGDGIMLVGWPDDRSGRYHV